MRIATGEAGAESTGGILMITVLLADDHPIVRQGLRALLEAEGRCQVVGEASDGLTAIDELTRLQPQVAILDVQIPDLNGLEVARRAQSQAPGTRIIMLSMYADEPYVLDALRHGAMGYVLKGTSTDDLLAAVDAVMAGRRYLSAPLNDRAIDTYTLRAAATEQPLDRYDLLTSREREVLQLAAQGLGNAEIGERLTISPRTAETHRANLLRKLGLQTQTELVRFAISRGLVSSGSSVGE
jgi:two-component system, NarL family, response regulator NreC